MKLLLLLAPGVLVDRRLERVLKSHGRHQIDQRIALDEGANIAPIAEIKPTSGRVAKSARVEWAVNLGRHEAFVCLPALAILLFKTTTTNLSVR
ncbi:hypothetical protein JQ620_34225 [Bradyrhizobium sp. AUGA SZCCT0274]|jgi:hypothetical protein|uniref:hypothetical protein n=1 Tax=Bradyrhizobium sp. AUGA SZCCT0274 TaxID=2807670 RepID=UPI001BAD022F|nr:hypothetical protein [Bradyrhizobium sp. AUGA SZCCT0274]MBR1245152.1 hypothetical protein [Bradyrhizobium sp. AUGA SZCCT0274]